MSRPRVLVLTKTTALGGAERLLANGVAHLDRDAFDYRLAACETGGPLEAAWRAAGLPFVALPHPSPLDPRNAVALRRTLARERIDLVHAHLPLPGVLARLAARGLPARLVYTEHNVQEMYRPASRRLNVLTYAWQDAVIAVSEGVRRSAAAAIGSAAAERTTVIPNGLDLAGLDREAARRPDPSPPRPPTGALALLVPATLAARKGQDVLLDALAHAGAASWQAWLAGAGASAGALVRRAHALGIADRVHFLGRREDVFALMRAADAVVLPSRYEGHPLALLEAMALGGAVVASAVGGVPEIVSHERTGLLVPPEDPPALAAALARLAHDRTLRRGLGENAARSVRARFPVARSVARTEALYRRCLDEQAPRSGARSEAKPSEEPRMRPRAQRLTRLRPRFLAR